MGIVIPNPGQWLLPELQDIGRTLQTTLQLPPDATIGHGFTLQPTSDGLLINLPDGGEALILLSSPVGMDWILGIPLDKQPPDDLMVGQIY